MITNLKKLINKLSFFGDEGKEIEDPLNGLPPSNLPILREMTGKLVDWTPDITFVFDFLPDIILVSDGEKILKCNAACSHYFKKTKEELVGKSLSSFFVLPDREQLARELGRVREGRRRPGDYFVLRLALEKEQIMPVSWSISNRIPSSEVGRFILVGRPVFDRCFWCYIGPNIGKE